MSTSPTPKYGAPGFASPTASGWETANDHVRDKPRKRRDYQDSYYEYPPRTKTYENYITPANISCHHPVYYEPKEPAYNDSGGDPAIHVLHVPARKPPVYPRWGAISDRVEAATVKSKTPKSPWITLKFRQKTKSHQREEKKQQYPIFRQETWFQDEEYGPDCAGCCSDDTIVYHHHPQTLGAVPVLLAGPRLLVSGGVYG